MPLGDALAAPALPIEAKGAVVMIDVVTPGGHPVHRGAGVIVKIDDAAVYVVTARHVVEEQGDPPDLTVNVRLFGSGSQERPAAVVAQASDLDLALLKITFRANPDLDPAKIKVALLSTTLETDAVYVVGQGGGADWKVSPEPDASAQFMPGEVEIVFTGSNVEEGDSGGGVFDPAGRLVGLLHKRKVDEYVTASSARRLIKFLSANGVEYVANPSARCLAGRRELEAAQLRFTARELAVAIAEADGRALAIYRAACADRPMIEQALATVVEKPDTAFSRMVEARDRSVDAAEWLAWAFTLGVDPNLRTPGNIYAEHSLLSLALSAENVPVAKALLAAGATPNPYLDNTLVSVAATRFLFPLAEIQKMTSLTDAEKRDLAGALIEAGVFIPTAETRRAAFNHGAASAARDNLAAARSLAPAGAKPFDSRKICKGKAVPWCSPSFLPRYFYSEIDGLEIEDLEIGPLIAFDDEFGYFAARKTLFALPHTGADTVLIYDDWGVLVANRDGSDLRLSLFSGPFAAGGLCKGSSTGGHCWRSRSLKRIEGKKDQWQLGGLDVVLVASTDPSVIGRKKRALLTAMLGIQADFAAKLTRPQQQCIAVLNRDAPIYDFLYGGTSTDSLQMRRLNSHLNASMISRDLTPYDAVRGINEVRAAIYEVCVTS